MFYYILVYSLFCIFYFRRVRLQCEIFLLGYNERVLLPHTINHYKSRLPNCDITFLDNESTDDSVAIALRLGCKVQSFGSQNRQDEAIQRHIKNNCWKRSRANWVIVADMDEWLTISIDELEDEHSQGTSILSVQGFLMLANSSMISLNDISLDEVTNAQYSKIANKNLCFRRDVISEINYEVGAHSCHPVGNVRYSKKIYANKHMSYMGLPFLKERHALRFARTGEMRKIGLDHHYSNDTSVISRKFYDAWRNSFKLSAIMMHTDTPIIYESSFLLRCGESQ